MLRVLICFDRDKGEQTVLVTGRGFQKTNPEAIIVMWTRKCSEPKSAKANKRMEGEKCGSLLSILGRVRSAGGTIEWCLAGSELS